MTLQEVQPYAEELVTILSPACEQIEIAGSIRRKKPEVKDIEILVRPILSVHEIALFGSTEEAPDALDDIIRRTIGYGLLEWDTVTKRNGPKYKRFRLPKIDCAVDMFIVDADNWGSQLAIRTGCWQFSKWFMTPVTVGGGMPAGLKHDGGYLWQNGEKLACPTERMFFATIWVDWYEPEERTPELVEMLYRRTG